MRNSKDAETRETKRFLEQRRTSYVPEAYLNKNCLPRAP
jgi:hypothetical protein